MPLTSIEKEKLQNIYIDIEADVANIQKDPSLDNMENLRKDLNKFFNNSECTRLIYTSNVDKLFFGIYAFPKVEGQDLIDIMFKKKRFIVDAYEVELDSKLFNGGAYLTAAEITALLLHDIGHLVLDSVPAETVKREIDHYLADNNETLKIPESVHYRGILAYGFADAMRKYTTIFEEDHYVASGITDEFIDWVDFKALINSAFSKISGMWFNHSREVRNKFITLSWVLRIYKNIKSNRIPALMAIKRCVELSPSKIEKKQLENMGKRVSRIDDDALLESSESFEEEMVLNEVRSALQYPNGKVYYNLMESIQNDIDDMILKQQSEEYNEPDGLADLLNSMNNKLACIQDYVDSDPTMSKTEYHQWNEMFKKLGKNRYDLVKGKLFENDPKIINTYSGYACFQ